ncbi:hypothetical protein C8J57DRAFT_202994 [Mycena rebaudengoi]|nr:hypothetical protein C8J57DRAFT_202994 [Mycena rebaudengoi]
MQAGQSPDVSSSFSSDANKTATYDDIPLTPISTVSGTRPSVLRRRAKSNSLSVASVEGSLSTKTPDELQPVIYSEQRGEDEGTMYSDSPISLPTLATLISPVLPLKVLVFPLWCAVVGGVILLAPTHANFIAFSTGFAPSSPPPSGIHAFAHWATVARYHVALYLAALVAIAYAYLPLGALLAAVSGAQFIHAWGDFSVDPKLALGADVRQTLYSVLVESECGFGGDGDDERVRVERVGDEYFLVKTPISKTRAQILESVGLGDDSDAE